MSGIVGSRLNCRGSGPVGRLGSDGQVFLSSGAGTSATYEAAAGGFDVSSITGATALAEEPALTDELVLSDAGTLKRLDLSHLMCNPMITVFHQGTWNGKIDTETAVRVLWGQVDRQAGGTWEENGKFTPGVAGWYMSHVNHRMSGGPPAKLPDENGQFCNPTLYKNGASHGGRGSQKMYGYNQVLISNGSGNHNSHDFIDNLTLVYLDADDYVEMYIYHDGGGTVNFGHYNQWTVFRLPGFGN